MYLDDSASHGAILDKNFNPIPVKQKGFMPVTSMGGIVIDNRYADRINWEITDLRQRIQKRLKIDYLPELHMRLMFGPTVDERKNPYFHSSMKERLSWCKAGYDIIFKYGQMGVLKTCGVSLEIEQVQSIIMLYHKDDIGKTEHEIIKYAFPKSINDYYGVATNPLVRMIASMMVAADNFAFLKRSEIEIYYDTSSASKGFTTSEGINVIRGDGHFHRLLSINESTPHDIQLLQLADLAAYVVYRKKLMWYRKKEELPNATDPGMRQALRGRKTMSIAIEGMGGEKFTSYYENQIAAMHAAYAAQKIRERYPDLSASYLVNPQWYDKRLSSYGSNTGFFQVIREDVIQNWRNGKRPPL